jgi:hypothetical protein
MANSSEFKLSTDTRLETPNPFPVEDGAVSRMGHAGGKSQLLIENPINRYLINSPMLWRAHLTSETI